MGRIWKLIRFLIALTVLTAFACAAQSCINENSACTPEQPRLPGESFRLRFQICAHIPDDSRADDEATEEGTVAENTIDIHDISYHLFGKDGSFLLSLKPEATETSVISSDYALYDVVAEISKEQDQTDYFRNNWTGPMEFYILAFANHSAYGVTVPTFRTGDTLAGLFDGNPIVINTLPDTGKIMHPYAEENKDDKTYHIPMAGLQFFSLNGSWFETQTGEAPIDLTALTGKSLNMLRTVAKLEVVDRINIKEGTIFNEDTDNSKIRIVHVAIDGIMKTCRLLPSEAQWKRNSTLETLQVAAPTVTSETDYLLPPALNESNGTITADGTESTPSYSLNFVYDETETRKREDRCPVYSCYVWEYARLTGIPGVRAPYLSVTVRNPQSEDYTDATFHIRLMTGMTEGAPSSLPIESLLRNHIYRYEIAGTSTEMSVKWSVCPMDKASANITFN